MTSPFDVVKNWRTGLVTETQAVRDGIWAGWNDDPSATSTTDTQVAQVLTEQADAIDSIANRTAGLVQAASLPRTQPLYISLDPQDDVSYPYGTYDQVIGQTAGKASVTFVTATQDRTYYAVKFAIGAAATMTTCLAAVYSVNTSTGLLTKVSDLGDIKSQLNFAAGWFQVITLPSPLIVTAGTILAFAIVQSGTQIGYLCTAAAVNANVLPTTNVTQYPKSFSALYTGASLPATIAAASLDPSYPAYYVPFIGFGYTTTLPAPPGIVVGDTFDRSSGLGSNWVARYGTPGITYSGSYGAATGDGSAATFITPFATLNQKATFAHKWDANTTRTTGVVLRADASSCVLARLKTTSVFSGGTIHPVAQVQIYTFASWSLGSDLTGGTLRASNGTGSTYPIDYPGNMWFQAQGNTYTIYGGASVLAQWVDSGALYATTGKYRGGFAIGSNGTISSWEAEDI